VVRAGGHQTPPDGGHPGHPLGGVCPCPDVPLVRLSFGHLSARDVRDVQTTLLQGVNIKNVVRRVCPPCPFGRLPSGHRIVSEQATEIAICPQFSLKQLQDRHIQW
jgi:hypothetical protein